MGCQGLFRFASLVFGNAPISSELFRVAAIYLPSCSDLSSEQIRTKQNKPLSVDRFRKSAILVVYISGVLLGNVPELFL